MNEGKEIKGGKVGGMERGRQRGREGKGGREEGTQKMSLVGRERQRLVSISPNPCMLDACLQIGGKGLKRETDDKLSVQRR